MAAALLLRKRLHAPEQVILFGSLACGEARRDSDPDNLVVMAFE